MDTAPERELKLTIPHREHYLHLRDHPAWGRRGPLVVQTNHYFDAAGGCLLASRILLRLREEREEREEAGEPAACTLTLKVGVEVRPGYFDALETEIPVAGAWLGAALAEPGLIIAEHGERLEAVRLRLDGAPLLYVGTLENHRVARDVDGWRLEVDRLILPRGREAHELELETDEPVRAGVWLREQTARHGILLEPASRTKMELLMDALRS